MSKASIGTIAQGAEVDIASLPYLERQLIVVSKKEALDALQNEVNSHGPVEAVAFLATGIAWTKVAATVASSSVVGGPLVGSLAGVTLVAVEGLRAWFKAQELGAPILPINQEQAAKLLFPPGHPREGVVYVGHPASAKTYYTMADFHRYVFEHKLCEAVELLMSLGATKIRVEHVSGWSTDFSAKLSVPLGSSSGVVEPEAKHQKNTQRSFLYEATLSGVKVPSLPGSSVWYPHEPTWMSVARGRLQYGLNEFSITVSYLDDLGVSAGLKATVAKAGLDVGGSFESHEATCWKLTGTFCPMQPDVP